ncbi:MAG: hypothetical protein E6I32_00025 [Chloroflexi bacterium]|nr:MAG: hypothetical protein E6I32_00025 [Chloroflexota bacterium]
MTAPSNHNRRFAYRGIDAIAPQQGLEALEQLLRQDVAQMVVVPANWQQMLSSFPGGQAPALLTSVVQGQATPRASQSAQREEDDLSVAALAAMEPGQRQARLQSLLRNELAIVLGLEPDEVDPQVSLNNLGLDSLMLLELRQRLENGLGIELPMESLIQDPNLSDLSVKLLAILESSASRVS